jgi:hypothetical protein
MGRSGLPLQILLFCRIWRRNLYESCFKVWDLPYKVRDLLFGLLYGISRLGCGISSLGYGISRLGWPISSSDYGISRLGWPISSSDYGISRLGCPISILGYGIFRLGWGISRLLWSLAKYIPTGIVYKPIKCQLLPKPTFWFVRLIPLTIFNLNGTDSIVWCGLSSLTYEVCINGLWS